MPGYASDDELAADDGGQYAGGAAPAPVSDQDEEYRQLGAAIMANMGRPSGGGISGEPVGLETSGGRQGAGTAMKIGASLAALPMAGTMVGAAAPALGAMAPRVGGAVSGGVQGYQMGGVKGALAGGALGAVTGKGPAELLGGVFGKAAKAASTAAKAEKTAETAVKVEKAMEAGTKVAEAGTAASKAADLMAFAKSAGTTAKRGEKVWMLLENGKPLKVLTPDQAAAAARAGKATTWVRNLWS